MELSRLQHFKAYTLAKIFIISSGMGLLVFLPIWIHHNGQLMDYGDYFVQYVAFIKEMKRLFLSGSLAWSWNSFLGDGFVNGYSYYTVFNPFAWFVCFFPDKYILYGTLAATVLKLGIATVSSYIFIRQFTKETITAEICALLYAFSSFSCINTNFYFFLDIVSVFPFVMYGIERIFRDDKKWAYIIALMVNAAINYYFYVATVIIVIIYVFFRLELYSANNWRFNKNKIITWIVCSILGTGLACFALVPSLYAMLGSGKATESIGTSISLFYWPQYYLEHLKALLCPAESNRYHAFYYASSWSSTACYLPVIGAFGYLMMWGQKGNWLRRLCSCLIVCFFVPVLNAMFSLFSSDSYTRWLYALALFFALAASLTIENLKNDNIPHKRIIYWSGTIVAGLLLLVPATVYCLKLVGISLVNLFSSVSETKFFMGYPAIAVIIVLTVINYLICGWFVFSKRHDYRKFGVLVIIMCVVNFGAYNYMNYDLHLTDYSNEYYYSTSLINGEESTQDTYYYRIDYPEEIMNYGLFKNLPSVNYYNSVQNSGSSKYALATGIADKPTDTTLHTSKETSIYTDALLSVRYYYDYNQSGEVPDGFAYERTNNNVDIYTNENYIPIGFTYDFYVLDSEIQSLSEKGKAQVMLYSLIIKDKDETEISQLLEHGNISDVNFKKDVSERQETAIGKFVGTSQGFSYDITMEDEDVLFLSVPYDSGWSITVNGEVADLYEANCGLFGVRCNSGSNTIEAIYKTKGQNTGIIISAVCLALSIAYVVFGKRKELEQ